MDTSDSFVTARMELEKMEYPHIVVDGLPDIAASFQLPFHGPHTVKDIQIMIESKTALPESSLRKSYGDTILNHPEDTTSLVSRMSRLSIEVKQCEMDHAGMGPGNPCSICRYPEPRSLNITHGTTLSCQLLEAKALSTDISHGLESSDNAVTDHQGIFRAEEAPGSGEGFWSTHLSTQAAESQQELKLYPLRPKFRPRRVRRIEQEILVLDLSNLMLEVCRIEDLEGTVRPYDSKNQ